MKLTAATITDDQIRELRNMPLSEIHHGARDARQARRPQAQVARLVACGLCWRARARCAKILNARSGT